MTAGGRHHRTCVHTKYRMPCDQYDALWEEGGGRCHICGQLERYQTGRGPLQIDHDARLGYWAVRGLLCVGCNVRLGTGTISGPEVDAYLAQPWYRSLPYAHLIAAEPPDERSPIELPEALRQVTIAARQFHAERARLPLDVKMVRQAKLVLVDAVRLASLSGGRQVDIAHATAGVWRTDDVLIAIRERREQPVIPRAWRAGDLLVAH